MLGDHIDQRGSVVLPDRLRFDFSHGKGVDLPEVQRIERICTDHIRRNLEVFSRETPLSEARNIHGGLHRAPSQQLHVQQPLTCR